ncbi:GNAT family N-acetyltransferase [Streptomyces diastatochromogenes]|uniref:GNAT family N-acetyltransferase n=1 Tax=Streptomyces diastatochromogenes TaxID=42236 RepID=A0A233S801_STRDA|nr:GNAT family N-acetyltransferase [Streptomyces diastatochromogenes]MCZ0985036.1 GNAT family N-acetyltransferase [Streptomyces diastatochromogenes]OXY91790.1 GNAT family N-acetyltransferase [Streptomyces diastatochromogenes]
MNQSAHVRPAEPEDYDRIIAVVDEWWERPMRSVLPRLFLDHFHRTSLVAEDGGGLAGFLVGLMSPSVPDAAYIHFVGVAPRARKEGLARGLYQRFFDMAAAEHRAEVRAITSPQNERSLAFHTAMGFTVSGPVRDHDGPGVDRMVFRLRLPGVSSGSRRP